MSTRARATCHCCHSNCIRCALRRRIAIANISTAPVLIGADSIMLQDITCSANSDIPRDGRIPLVPFDRLSPHYDN
jgi:hypothetical protein